MIKRNLLAGIVAAAVMVAGLLAGRATLAQARVGAERAAQQGEPDRAAERAADATIRFGGELGFQYSPKQVTISPGDSVTWQGDFTMHPLVSDEGLWQTVNSGATFTHTFDTPGTYHFHCFIHGGAGGVGMSGTVVVEAGGGGFSVFLPIVRK